MKKISVFLGGYLNDNNPQNLNCLALAEFLDGDKFDIYALKKAKGNVDISRVEERCHLFTHNPKIRHTKLWNYIKALWCCDILYLPKREKLNNIILLNYIFRKKLFLTIEGLYDNESITGNKKKSLEKLVTTIAKTRNVYSITHFLRKYNKKNANLDSKNTVLYLGVNRRQFKQKTTYSGSLNNIVFIANNLEKKGIDDYISLASQFTNTTFHIIGKNLSDSIRARISQYSNIIHHGILSPSQLNDFLQTIDLHILPSKREGFPKVTLETAAAGIPSVVYDTYGASEWIKNGHNGFIVRDFNELKNTVARLMNDRALLIDTAKNAAQLSIDFDWLQIVKSWEKEIISMVS